MSAEQIPSLRLEHIAELSRAAGEGERLRAMRDEARLLIVNGFIEPFTKQLPMEYAVELNRLIELEMEGSVG